MYCILIKVDNEIPFEQKKLALYIPYLILRLR